MRRIKIGNTIQFIIVLSIALLGLFTLACKSIYIVTFVFMIVFLFYQPIITLFLTIINHKTMFEGSIEPSGYIPIDVQFTIHNREIRNFVSYLNKRKNSNNCLYHMSRNIGYDNPIYYSLPMKKQINVYFVEETSDFINVDNPSSDSYTVAIFNHEENFSSTILGNGFDAVMFQKEEDIILYGRVYSIPSTSKELHILHRLVGKIIKKRYDIRMYGNVYFIKSIVETYLQYKKL